MLPSQPNPSYSKSLSGSRLGSKYRQVNEQKRNITGSDVKKIHQSRNKTSDYSTKETNSSHRHQNHPMRLEQSSIPSIDSMITRPTPNIRTTSRSRRCSNCCGGLPGRGPGSGLTVTKSRQPVVGRCCCQNEKKIAQVFNQCSGNTYVPHESSMNPDERRLRGGGGSRMRFPYKNNFLPPSTGSANEDGSDVKYFEETMKNHNTEIRFRGGCGGCDISRNVKFNSSCDSKSRDTYPSFACPASYGYSRGGSRPPVRFVKPEVCGAEDVPTKGCCPCGGCGGAACSDNPGGGKIDGGCCTGSHAKGPPCKCKCQSCKDFHPCGGCGGQSCGKIYSCAGSGGGTCCFPRNYKRRSGPECCGGGNTGCGGCC